jgi:two-component system, OmpR family, copper resistance phosphate regulon response regulator CusR
MRLLVAESDPALASFLHESFNEEHYAVDLTGSDDGAKQWVEERNYDLAILDLNLAQDEGTQLLQHVRTRRRQLPILVLSSQNLAERCVQILDMGADDLVLKPFSFSELSARVRALLRRDGRAAEAVMWVDDLEMNRTERSVRRASRTIELTPKEFNLLECLMRNAGESLTRAEIFRHVWNSNFDTRTNVVDVYINYVRKKIEGPLERKLIHTVRGIGYQMRRDSGRCTHCKHHEQNYPSSD